MPILQLPSNPPRSKQQPGEESSGTGPDQPGRPNQPIKVRTGRFGELEEHELIHLIDSLDDERSRARFRESIYISVIIWIVIGWFLFYGPRVLWHQPTLRDPIALLKQHDKEQLTYVNPNPAPRPIKPPVVNQKMIQQLQKQAREAPRTPLPPTPQAAASPPPPQQEARNTAPPVPTPAMPLPAAPSPAPSVDTPLPAAPHPNPSIAQNSESAGSAIRDAMRGALNGRSGAQIGAPGSGGPLQAGTQILSDIGDWDPSAYMRRLHNDIQRNWDPLIPAEVQPPLMKKGVTGIRFWILRDGSISGPVNGQPALESPSGDTALDRAAWGAIIGEGQYPPLPNEYKGPYLDLRVGFFYNTPIR
jgi:hypothetical protein